MLSSISLDPSFTVTAAEEPKAFIPYLQAVGRGAKLRRDLTQEEAAEAIRLIVRRKATPAQIGGFLIGQRVKGEAADEIRGFTQAMRQEFIQRISPRVENLLDLAVPFDGKVKTAQLAPAIAILLASCGVPVIMHGDEGVPTKEGITHGSVLRALRVPADLEPSEVERMIERVGLAYLAAAKFAPLWHTLTPLRREFGLRTALNTIEKLFNPADAPYQISGFFHGEYADRIRIAHTGTRGGWIVRGEEGSIEMAAGRATRIFAADSANEIVLDPNSVGLAARERIAPPFEVEAHAKLNAEVIAGTPGPATDQATFTAGVILWLVGAASTVADGFARSQKAILLGAAQQRLILARSFQ